MVYFRGATKIGAEGYADAPGDGPVPVPPGPSLPWYMNYWIIGGIITAVIVLAIVIYMMMKKSPTVERMYY